MTTIDTLADVRDHDPYPFFEAARMQGPVVWDAGMEAWLVLGYDEARYVQVHEELFRHPYATIPTAAEIYGGPRAILLLQGDEHHAVHQLLLKHFTPRRVDEYRREFIADLFRRRLDRLNGRDRIDLASEYAGVVPSDVIAAMLGLDWRDEALMDQCRAWNSTMFRWTETFGENEAAYLAAKEAAENLNDVLMPVIRARRDHPQDDLISALWREGPTALDAWGEEEVLAQARVLFFAGTDTTTNFLKNSIYLLVSHPELQDRLRGDEKAIADFGEESLRILAPVQFRIRVATTDVELGGQVIKSGDRVHPVNAAANRDPGHYGCPAHFDMDRDKVNDHLAFNVGPRFCVGAGLSRGEGIESLRLLLERYETIRFDPDAEPPRYRGFMPRAFSPLNVIVTPAGD